VSTADIPAFLATWAAAEQAGDTGAVGALLTDDFVGVGPLGFALPKEAWIERLAGDLHYEAFALSDLAVREHGDTALVTATHSARGDYAGTPLPEALRASLALVREGKDGGWLLAGLHFSFIGSAN
jgi:ketosteroid isomerase-like protein